jgi:DNA-binding SARP family transcriptional activator
LSRGHICLLGEVDIRVDGVNVTDKLSNKAIGLLCFLCTNKGKKFTRDRLCTFFWNNTTIENARYNLRYSLWVLRKIFNHGDCDLFISSKDSCMINPDFDYYIDVLDFNFIIENFTAEENPILALEKCKEIYNGEFLEGFYLKNCPDFNDWIFYEREKYQESYSTLLLKLAKLYSKSNMYNESILVLNEVLKINPYREDVYLELMRLHIQTNNVQAALKEYEKCEYILREELNIRPNEEVIEYYRNVICHSKQITTNLSKVAKVKDNSAKNSIVVECYPVNKIKYFIISCIIEEIIRLYSIEQLIDLDEFILKDLLRIQPKVLLINKNLRVEDNLNHHNEENRIYFSLESLLLYIEKIFLVDIHIKNMTNIDDVSYNILKLFTLKNPKCKISILIDGSKIVLGT